LNRFRAGARPGANNNECAIVRVVQTVLERMNRFDWSDIFQRHPAIRRAWI